MTLRKNFRVDVAAFKGKVIDDKLISMLSRRLEDSFVNWIYNEGFALENIETGMTIDAYGSEKWLKVNSKYDIGSSKEYETLSGAIKASNDAF